MRSASWRVDAADEKLVARLVAELQLVHPVARVLALRCADESRARSFLEPRLADLLVPDGMAGLPRAIERLGDAVVAGETIGIFGDYDVDGVSSTALIADYLGRCGARLQVRVARRDEGYGFAVPQAEEMLGRACSVLLLADCGTSDHAAVDRVATAGVDVIAVDHHRVGGDGDWPGFALVNPHQESCGFAEKGLCTAGLAFYVVATLRRHLQAGGRAAPDPRDDLDLVALGTIADVAPLRGVNRILVDRGLQQLARTSRPGLRELLRLADLSGRRPRSEDVAWRIAPRLNAPGRLGDASVALSCLLSRDESEAVRDARRCNALNEERKAIQQRILDEAQQQAEQRADDSFCLVASDRWHAGVNGIVASKLAETLGKPAAVVTWEGPRGRASARSVPGLDLFALLSRCQDHLQRFGGHAAAAGFSITPEQLEPLREALCRVTAPRLEGVGRRPLGTAAVVSLSQVDYDLCRQLRRLEPYGEQNREPVFGASGVKVESARIVGGQHLRLALRQQTAVRQAIGFGLADRLPEVGERLDVAFVAEIDDYHGPRLQLRLVDITPAGEGLDRGGQTDD